MTSHRVATFATLIAAAAVAALPAASAADENARGRELFDLCKQCHGESAQGMQLSLAPAIAGIDQWYLEAQLKNFRSGARGTNPEDVGGLRMYPMSQWLRSEDDVTAVASYVAGMPAADPMPVVEGGDAERGKQYWTTCAACHGQNGEGNQAMNAPPLVLMSDWYLVTQLNNFKAGIRGGNQNNPNAMMMRGMAMSLADEQAVKDVVAYITQLGD